jgi:hypothetical protein
MDERKWLAERRKERRAVAEAVSTVKESPAQPNPDAEVSTPADESTTETSRKESEVSEGADAQTEAETEGQQAQASQGETGDEGYFPETLNEFAEAVGVDPKDFLQGVTAPVKVNGEQQNVPLTDLLEAYSSKAERDRLGTAAAEERKALEAASEQHQQEYQDRLTQADEFLHAMRASIDLGPSDQQLNEMLNSKQIDERGYLVARSERDSKIAAFNAAIQQRNDLVKQQVIEADAKQTEYRKAQQDGLMAWKPELQEPTKLSAFESRVRTGLTGNYDFTAEEVGNFFSSFDLRQIKIVNDAIAFRELQAQEKPIKQRLAQLPKLQKPGAKRSSGQLANDKVLGARSRLKSSGSVQDGAALLKARRLARGNQTHGGSQ